jgi:hypothetical protein
MRDPLKAAACIAGVLLIVVLVALTAVAIVGGAQLAKQVNCHDAEEYPDRWDECDVHQRDNGVLVIGRR